MISKIYNLPELIFVGGETKDFRFHLYAKNGEPFEMDDATAVFSVIESANRMGKELISKNMSIVEDVNGLKTILAVSLESDDTLALSGKFIYQLAVKDNKGKVEVPSQGFMYISNNIDKEARGIFR